MKRESFFIFLAILFVSGCMVGPNFKNPDVNSPLSFTELKNENDENFSIKNWWKNFNDKDLIFLVEEAKNKNYDYLIAQEKICESRAFYRIEVSKLFPQINASGYAKRLKVSEDLYISGLLGPRIQNLFETGFDASWEIDFFGKLRRAKEAAFANILSKIQEKEYVEISVISEVAKMYVEMRGAQQEIKFLEKEIKNQKKIIDLKRDLFSSGVVDKQGINFEEAELERLFCQLQIAKSLNKIFLYNIATLIGKNPEEMEGLICNVNEIPFFDKIPKVLPSELLARRPDIQMALFNLMEANANIGVAKADLFPRFSLLGIFGWRSDKAHNLFSAGGNKWELGPSFYWPILDFGKIRAQIKVETSKQKQSFLAYEKTLVNALKDVEISFSTYFKEKERFASFIKEVNFLKSSLSLNEDLYLSGVKSLIYYLQDEQKFLKAQIDMSNSKKELIINLISTYKALGGEW